MLGKLMKHEMKACSRLLLPLLSILFVLTVIDRIVFELPVFQGGLAIIPVFITLIYLVSITAIAVVSTVIVIYRFYKNLITDEGYLMFTLPVKSCQLINSKLIISFFWILVSVIAVLASLYVVFATPDQFHMVRDEITAARHLFHTEFRNDGTVFILETLAGILLGIIFSILQIYVSIAIGQLFNGHKILGSFAAYISLTTILQIIWIALLLIVGLLSGEYINNIKLITHVFYPVAIFLVCITCALYYYVINYIFQKKLNLE
jgi:hypothetical protein